jgi:hypothetical protein
MSSSQHSPSRIKPQRGQIPKNSPKSPASERWAVLHEDEAGSYLTHDTGHLGPESALLSVDPRSLSCGADVLAGKPASHDVNKAAPRSAVKGAHVIPNRERREGSVVLSCHKHSLGVGLAFNGANASVSKQLSGEDASTSARE